MVVIAKKFAPDKQNNETDLKWFTSNFINSNLPVKTPPNLESLKYKPWEM